MKTDISGLKTIQESFQTLKSSYKYLLITLILTLIASLSAMICLIRIYSERVFIVSPYQTFMAKETYDHESSIYEVRNFVRIFCDNLFGWDKNNYTPHMEFALSLIDHSDGIKLFNTFKANEVYENLVSTSAKVSVKMDSIHVEMGTLPIQGVFYLTQIWESPGGIQSQKIKARFELISISRSENNPFGLQLQKIYFLEYPLTHSVKSDSLPLIKINP